MGKRRTLSDVEAQEFRKVVLRPEYAFDGEFRLLLDHLIDLVLEHGVSQISATRKDGTFGFDDIDHQQRFVGAVHEGWKTAQSLILDELLVRLLRRTALKTNLADARRSRDPDAFARARRELGMCEAQTLSLRRILDSICWSLLNHQHHVVRRLHMRESPWSLTVEKINAIRPLLDDVNLRPHMMAVACDATTFIQTFDLLVMDHSAGQGVIFVEVKSGEKNWDIVSKAHRAAELDCVQFEELATRDMSAVDRQHFQRAKRQAERAHGIDQVLSSGQGTDHNTGAGVYIGEIPEPPVHFAEIVADLCDGVSSDKQWAIGTVDDCLFVGAYGDPQLVVAFFAWIRGFQDGELRVVSMLDTTFDFLTRPLLSLPLPVRHIRRLAATELTLVLSLDVEKWMARANTSLGYDAMFFETPRQSRRAVAKKKGYTLPMQDGRLIAARSEGGATMYLGSGALDRIFFDFQTPLSVARSMTRTARPNGFE
jgi:hypothetical protein